MKASNSFRKSDGCLTSSSKMFFLINKFCFDLQKVTPEVAEKIDEFIEKVKQLKSVTSPFDLVCFFKAVINYNVYLCND